MSETTTTRIIGFLERGVVEDFPLITIFKYTDLKKEFTKKELKQIIRATRKHRPHLYKQFFSDIDHIEQEIKELINFIKVPKLADEKIISLYNKLCSCHNVHPNQLTPIHDALKKHRSDLNDHPRIVEIITKQCFREIMNS